MHSMHETSKYRIIFGLKSVCWAVFVAFFVCFAHLKLAVEQNEISINCSWQMSIYLFVRYIVWQSFEWDKKGEKCAVKSVFLCVCVCSQLQINTMWILNNKNSDQIFTYNVSEAYHICVCVCVCCDHSNFLRHISHIANETFRCVHTTFQCRNQKYLFIVLFLLSTKKKRANNDKFYENVFNFSSRCCHNIHNRIVCLLRCGKWRSRHTISRTNTFHHCIFVQGIWKCSADTIGSNNTQPDRCFVINNKPF